ncbi:NAD(P)-binding domain-containing protein [Gilliamella sp. B2776]|uniref:flavin-containing monooxygenase n=1 Tax=unclassified Gilliamella TaxID=2685620 RepID=UPI00226AAC42|nr:MULTISPECIES: NAD(P)/FAD-dependent oxidoreductase [unclassified Gilliamella]MCX8648996.1 NAD(P)-binding domain-containing protein [Gilliamella sp. B2779]MCX8653128.1 NAD(P)-binding domain-containing protein [Gilliamella sp. B2737]MCX8655388.1 NAD(P)-binding domain-containing protein [Gilliamella sp. B2894]MCX8664153.1 NAD(P)-binding domain-containing protein [Gilliamella sp. B2887]MCX8690808.1 NAD(P)-binding domain-containing protein [Gilliamella sp. B2776]
MIYDCLIVGAGQAGLSLASFLSQKKISVIILERDKRIGDVWRRRPDSMKLFTPRIISQLPGLVLKGDPKGYPDKNEIADYLELYAQHNKLNVLLNKNVCSVEYNENIYSIKTQDGEIFHAKCLVNATGANQKVDVPEIAKCISPEIKQITIDQYQNPDQLKEKKIAIIGDGSGGRQIAKELAKTHNVTLFCGAPRPFFPKELFGVNTLTILKKLSILDADTRSIMGRWLMRRGFIPCNDIVNKVLRKMGVQFYSKLISVDNKTLISDSGEKCQPDVIIWSLGYAEETNWLTIPNTVDSAGFICLIGHDLGGKTSYPDLFVVGKKWLSCRASELICGCVNDAKRVANFIEIALHNK